MKKGRLGTKASEALQVVLGEPILSIPGSDKAGWEGNVMNIYRAGSGHSLLSGRTWRCMASCSSFGKHTAWGPPRHS